MARFEGDHERIDVPPGLRRRVVLVSVLVAALSCASVLMAAGVLPENALDWLPCRAACETTSEDEGSAAEEFDATGFAIVSAVFVAVGLASLALGFRFQRCGVDVSESRVRVRAVLRDRTIPREALEGIHTASAWWPTLWWTDAAGGQHSMLLAAFAQSRDTPPGLADAIDARLDRLAVLLGDLG